MIDHVITDWWCLVLVIKVSHEFLLPQMFFKREVKSKTYKHTASLPLLSSAESYCQLFSIMQMSHAWQPTWLNDVATSWLGHRCNVTTCVQAITHLPTIQITQPSYHATQPDHQQPRSKCQNPKSTHLRFRKVNYWSVCAFLEAKPPSRSSS